MGEMKTPFLGKAIKMNLTFPPPGMGVGKLHILTHSDIYYICMIHNLCPVWFLLKQSTVISTMHKDYTKDNGNKATLYIC